MGTATYGDTLVLIYKRLINGYPGQEVLVGKSADTIKKNSAVNRE